MALTPSDGVKSGARVRSLVSARESKRVELTSSVLTYNTLKPGSRLFQRLAWPRRIKTLVRRGTIRAYAPLFTFTFTYLQVCKWAHAPPGCGQPELQGGYFQH